LGGETAEMPGVYAEGAFDLAGTVVGLVSRDALLPRPEAMQPGDALIGLPSSGPHTNGYSLIRHIIEGRDFGARLSDGQMLADALLAPHRCYVAEIDRLQAAGLPLVGLAHLTGGGFIENLPRILPGGLAAQIDTDAWDVPPLFRDLVVWGGIAQAEAFRVFNMGIGMVLVVPAAAADAVMGTIPGAVRVGRLVARGDGPAVMLR
jgi:phosphoribosylformylglycinamidine cyclo-ligase